MNKKVMISFGMVLLTMAYCYFIWLGFGFFSIILESDVEGSLPLITRLTAFHGLPFPYHAAPWQGLAVLSMILNIVWIFHRQGQNGEERMIALPAVCHTGWIVFSICCHGIGMLSAYVMFVSVLK